MVWTHTEKGQWVYWEQTDEDRALRQEGMRKAKEEIQGCGENGEPDKERCREHKMKIYHPL